MKIWKKKSVLQHKTEPFQKHENAVRKLFRVNLFKMKTGPTSKIVKLHFFTFAGKNQRQLQENQKVNFIIKNFECGESTFRFTEI